MENKGNRASKGAEEKRFDVEMEKPQSLEEVRNADLYRSKTLQPLKECVAMFEA